MTTLEILEGARELIATPEKWTKRAFARDQSGACVNSASQNAVCLCPTGAILRASNSALVGSAALDSVLAALSFSSWERLWIWNDAAQRTHSEVLSRLDAAIEAERKKAQS